MFSSWFVPTNSATAPGVAITRPACQLALRVCGVSASPVAAIRCSLTSVIPAEEFADLASSASHCWLSLTVRGHETRTVRTSRDIGSGRSKKRMWWSVASGPALSRQSRWMAGSSRGLLGEFAVEPVKEYLEGHFEFFFTAVFAQ